MRIVLLCGCLIFSIILYLFIGELYTALLLAAVLVFPTVSLVLGAVAARGVDLSFVVPERIRKGETITCKLIIENQSSIPIFFAALHLTVRNRLSNKEQLLIPALSVSPKKKREYAVSFECASCGQYEFIGEKFELTDFLGLHRTVKNSGIKETRVVMPDVFRTQIVLSDANSSLAAGDASTSNKKGSDHTEPLQYRDFVDGDPMNRIHYKLSSKHGRLMIADGSQPRRDAYLFLWNGGMPPTGTPPSVVDALAGAFVSLCSSFADAGVHYTAAWKSSESGGIVSLEVTTKDELYNVIRGIMGTGGFEAQMKEYLRIFGEKQFPAVAYFSYGSQTDIAVLGAIGQVTPFTCKLEGGSKDGTGYFFTPTDYQQVLSRVSL